LVQVDLELLAPLWWWACFPVGITLRVMRFLTRSVRATIGVLAVSFWFLLLLVTAGNLVIGFGIGLHYGFGPDLARLNALLRELTTVRRKKRKAS
jgi:hypothetical protein